MIQVLLLHLSILQYQEEAHESFERTTGFLKKELNLDRSNVERMNVDQWHEVRMKCFDIETEEAGMVVDDRGVISERGEWQQIC